MVETETYQLFCHFAFSLLLATYMPFTFVVRHVLVRPLFKLIQLTNTAEN